MRRIVVIGGWGFFGSRIAERLSGALTAARSAGDLRLDVNDAESIRRLLQPLDVVVDAAGPFQRRSMALLDIALQQKIDIVDISDSPDYCSRVYAREEEIRTARIRVLTACSSLSTVSAAAIIRSGIEQPRSLSVRLVPASRYTANRGSAQSMLEGIKAGAVPTPRGLAIGSVDAVTLPPVWPSLQRAEFIVDAGIPGVNAMLLAASRRPVVARLIGVAQPVMLPVTRTIGRREGVISYTVRSDRETRTTSLRGRNSFLAAVLPAVLAARALSADRFDGIGLIPPTRHVDSAALFGALEQAGIAITDD